MIKLFKTLLIANSRKFLIMIQNMEDLINLLLNIGKSYQKNIDFSMFFDIFLKNLTT